MGAPRRILVYLFPGERGQQLPEVGGQGILHLIILFAPFQRCQGRGSERVGQMDLANRRYKGNDFDPVSLSEVVLGNRTSSHSTWSQVMNRDDR